MCLAVFLLTVAVRLLVLTRLYDGTYPIENQGDMRFYGEWAKRILAGEWSDGFAFYGLPGYAFLLAGFYKLCGISPFLVGVIQAFAEGIVAVLICSLANLIFFRPRNPNFSVGIGVLAALGYAFYLPAQAFSVILMPTCLLTLVFWTIVWWCVKPVDPPRSPWQAGGIGAAIGVMALAVATIFFVVPLVVTAIFLKSRNRIGSLMLLIAGILLGCSPAMLHNRLVAHDPVALSAHGGLNFFIGNNAASNGYLVVPPGLRSNQEQMLADSIAVAERALGAKPGEKIPRSEVSEYWASQARLYIKEHPGAWIRLLRQKLVNFWNAYQYDDLSVINAFAAEGLTTSGIRFGLVAALGLAGMAVAMVRGPSPARWVVAAILLHLASLLTVFITERYRMAAVPGLLILGAGFLSELWDEISNWNWKPVAALLATVATSAWLVSGPVPNRGASALDSYNSGIRYLTMKDSTKAARELELAWCYAPENENTNLALGNLYLMDPKPAWARAFLRRCLRINPKNTSAQNNLGFAALAENNLLEARDCFRQTLEVDPRELRAAFQLADILGKLHDRPAARQVLDDAGQFHPDDPSLHELREQLDKPNSNP